MSRKAEESGRIYGMSQTYIRLSIKIQVKLKRTEFISVSGHISGKINGFSRLYRDVILSESFFFLK